MYLPEGKVRPASKANKFTAICELNEYRILEPGRLKPLGASTVCYRESCTFTTRVNMFMRTEFSAQYCSALDGCMHTGERGNRSESSQPQQNVVEIRHHWTTKSFALLFVHS